MGLGHDTCEVCGTGVKANRLLHSCIYCGKRYHVSCGQLVNVRTPENVKGKACSCRPSDASIIPGSDNSTPSSSRDASPACTNLDITGRALSTTDGRSTPTGSETDGALATILARLDEIGSLPARFQAVENKLDELSSKVEIIPQLTARIDTLEARLDEICQQQTGFAQRLTVAETSPGLPADTTQEIADLQRANSDLRERISNMRPTSTELVLGGLRLPEAADLHKSAYAALRCIHDRIELREVIVARSLPSKKDSRAPDAHTHNQPGNTGGANINPAASTGNGGPEPRPPLLIVTLSGRPLLEAVIGAKARRKKVHSSEIDPQLLRLAGCTDVLPPALLNVNEFLPQSEFKLRKMVRAKAKEKNAKFTHFIQGGRLIVRAKAKNSSNVRIDTPQDSEDFLGTLA